MYGNPVDISSVPHLFPLVLDYSKEARPSRVLTPPIKAPKNNEKGPVPKAHKKILLAVRRHDVWEDIYDLLQAQEGDFQAVHVYGHPPPSCNTPYNPLPHPPWGGLSLRPKYAHRRRAVPHATAQIAPLAFEAVDGA